MAAIYLYKIYAAFVGNVLLLLANCTEFREYCNMESFEARCASNEVIVTESARYGRMRVGRCVSIGYGTVGCAVNALPFLDRRCSGRGQCSFKLPDDSLYALQPCPRDVTSYLEASYRCLKVTSPRQQQCSTLVSMPVAQTLTGTYLSSVALQNPGTCALRLEAFPGQRVNITLWDFGATWQHVGTESTCRSYGKITEGGSLTTPVCGGTERIKHMYLSQAHVVDLHLKFTTDEDEVKFVIHFHVVGCPTPDLPSNMWFRRLDDDRLVIGCNATSQVWHLTCDDTFKWQGTLGTCEYVEASSHGTGQSDSQNSFWKSFVQKWSTTEGLLMIVALGVVLGFVIGVILLLAAVAFLRRQARAHAKQRVQTASLMTSPYYDVDCLQTDPTQSTAYDMTSCPYGCVLTSGSDGTLRKLHQQTSYEPMRVRWPTDEKAMLCDEMTLEKRHPDNVINNIITKHSHSVDFTTATPPSCDSNIVMVSSHAAYPVGPLASKTPIATVCSVNKRAWPGKVVVVEDVKLTANERKMLEHPYERPTATEQQHSCQ